MASRFENTNPVVREITINGREVRATFTVDGISFVKKGDKSRVKKTVALSWADVFKAAGAAQGEEAFSYLFGGTKAPVAQTSTYAPAGDDIESLALAASSSFEDA